MVQKEVWEGKPAEAIWIPRDQWGAFDPHLLSEGLVRIEYRFHLFF